MKKLNSPGSLLLFLIVSLAVGCTLITSNSRKTVPVSNQVKFEDAFEKALKACRSLDMLIHEANKDAGQLTCHTSYGMKANYSLNIFLEKDGAFVKNIDIKAYGHGQSIPPSESGGNKLLEEYINALRQLKVE